MPCVPAASALVVHFAVRLLPEPLSATAEQPPIELVPSLKFTVPVGELPLMVAVKVTAVPAFGEAAEETIAVVLAAMVTTCESAGLVEAALFASPL